MSLVLVQGEAPYTAEIFDEKAHIRSIAGVTWQGEEITQHPLIPPSARLLQLKFQQEPVPSEVCFLTEGGPELHKQVH